MSLSRPHVVLIAFLSNTDSSILKLKIKGYQTRVMTTQQALKLLSAMEGIGSEAAYYRVQERYACLDTTHDCLYFLARTYNPNAGGKVEPSYETRMIADLIKLF
ncbi:MAG: hypothetical protein JRN15_05635 [Nitrososphaerota archaeon]|nr:hypothetical protein [Nitrososphaerota archaeon]